uniref:Uncharacterized protein n=1 Tax=Timema bartmani TaxID=61472 RepID=A0A7R9F8D8_9NEOP|nr:unnamed protein product [Timema bartmani]
MTENMGGARSTAHRTTRKTKLLDQSRALEINLKRYFHRISLFDGSHVIDQELTKRSEVLLYFNHLAFKMSDDPMLVL